MLAVPSTVPSWPDSAGRSPGRQRLAQPDPKETVRPPASGHSAHEQVPERIQARVPVDDLPGHVRFPVRVRLKRTGDRKRTTREGQARRRLL